MPDWLEFILVAVGVFTVSMICQWWIDN